MSKKFSSIPALICIILTISSCNLHRHSQSSKGYGGAFPEAVSHPLPGTLKSGESQALTTEPALKNENPPTPVTAEWQESRKFRQVFKSLPGFHKKITPADSTVKKSTRSKRDQPIERNSLISLLLAICGIFIIPLLPLIPAFILGIVGIVKYKENPGAYDASSIAYAVAGITIASVFLLLFAAYIFFMLLMFSAV